MKVPTMAALLAALGAVHIAVTDINLELGPAVDTVVLGRLGLNAPLPQDGNAPHAGLPDAGGHLQSTPLGTPATSLGSDALAVTDMEATSDIASSEFSGTSIEVLAGVGAPPLLTLAAIDDCLSADDDSLVVAIDLSGADVAIVGGQFLLNYDNTVLDFLDISPGGAPWTQQVFEQVDEQAGLISYAVGVFGSSDGATEGTMVLITFAPLMTTCGTAGLVDFADPMLPQQNLLSDDQGTAIVPNTTDLGLVVVDTQDPELDIPADVDLPCGSDAGSENTGEATATDNCDDDVLVEASDVGGCPGTITRTWTATDNCGNTATGVQTITCGVDECDDGDACNGTETCDPVSGCVDGTPLNCDDSNPCTDDSCDPDAGCVNTPNDMNVCDDENVCTENDACSGGMCVGTDVDCDDANACTDDACDPVDGCTNTTNDMNACDDGDACTENDACAIGACVGSAVDCDDGVPCTIDACDPMSGCTNVPENTQCDDGNECTDDVCDPIAGCSNLPAPDAECLGDEDCDNGQSCVNCQCGCTGPQDCDDGNDCTEDLCMPGDPEADPDGCLNVVAEPGSPCGNPDQTECNNPDTCSADGQCLPNNVTPGTSCNDDMDACTIDACNGAGACVMVGELNCDDSVDCTADSCLEGVCINDPQDSACDDMNDCTVDVCSTMTGCSNEPVENAECDTDQDCDAGEFCIDCICVEICTKNADCDDNNPCTINACDLDNPEADPNGCVNTDVEADTPCDSDSSVCTIGVCDGAGTCDETDTLTCADADPCTEDLCDPEFGCVFPLSYDPAAECCSPSSGEVVVISDDNACTEDFCDPETGTVSRTLTFDRFVECCNPEDGEIRLISDNNACTEDFCNPSNGLVIHLINFEPLTECCNPATGVLGSVNADINQDGTIDAVDLGALLGSWGPCKPGACCNADGAGSCAVELEATCYFEGGSYAGDSTECETDCPPDDPGDDIDSCFMDLNCDGAVNLADISILLGLWASQ